jgi:lambda family phage minor tail protein L
MANTIDPVIQSITFGQTAQSALSTPRSLAAAQSITFGQGVVVKTLIGATTIKGEVSALHAQAMVEMFIYDDTNIGGLNVVRWHPGTTVLEDPITWQGQTYQPMPIDVTGFSTSASGSLPRPQLKASNITGALGGYLRSMQGAVGAKITRRRTLARYLDAVNFPLGNPNADASAFFPDEIYYLSRKTNENPIWIEYELAASFDVAGVQLPRRQVIATTCEWVYRSAECGYAGPPVQDINGNPTSNPALDRCRKTLDACKARFGSNPLNTSAFPGSLLVQL